MDRFERLLWVGEKTPKELLGNSQDVPKESGKKLISARVWAFVLPVMEEESSGRCRYEIENDEGGESAERSYPI